MQEAKIQPLIADPAIRLERLEKEYPHSTAHIAALRKILKDKPFAAELIEYLTKELISRNDPSAKEIINAVNKLKDEDPNEVIQAIKKSARAIYNNQINIFFSYKLKDETVATAVVEQIRKVSDSKLKITYAKEFESGEDYREKILRATRNAHWFILLLPDPNEDWDWCLYESGLFRAKQFPGDRLVCIHHADSKIPDQISNFNAVEATEKRLQTFFHELFCEPNPIPGMDPINKAADVKSISHMVAKEVSPPSIVKTIPLHDFVSIKISDDNPLDTNDDLNSMNILDSTEGKLALFGKSEPPATWGELTSNVVNKNEEQWRTELRTALRATRNKDIPNEIHSSFTGCNNKHYRPVLHAKIQTKTTGKILSYFINFIEDISVIDRGSLPQELNVMVTALRTAFRFRWEVLENKRYLDHVMCEEEADEIRMSIDRIMLEANQVGLMDPELLKAQFDSDADKTRIDTMFTHWSNLMNQEGTGLLDEALRNHDAPRVSEILKELSPLNKEFLTMASKRFSEVLA